jgi:WhiB family redox-sensing transcriptional regulator
VARPSVTYGHETWRRWAACRHSEPELFFPTRDTGTAATEIERAKAVCAACPVQAACLRFAFATNQEFGVWGGQDEDERKALRRQWRNSVHG